MINQVEKELNETIAPLPHKVICKDCGWISIPSQMYKSESGKYTCKRCGATLFNEKDTFKNELLKRFNCGRN